MSPDHTLIRINHNVTNKRRHNNNNTDVRLNRGADFKLDHFLVVSTTLRMRISQAHQETNCTTRAFQ